MKLWLQKHTDAIWFTKWAIAFAFAFALVYVFVGEVIGGFQREIFTLREKLTLAEYDRDLYYATSRDQRNFIENECKPLPPMKMSLSQPLKVKLKPKPVCIKRNSARKCVKWSKK